MNTFILEEQKNHIPVDVYQKLSDNRILFIDSYINDKIAVDITAALLLKDAEDPTNKISIFINSYGGDIRSIFMIYDMMKIIRAPIETICMGAAMSEAVLLLAAGTHGLRFATQNAMICPNQLMYTDSQYSDLTDAKITLDQIKLDNKKFIEALSKCTKKPVKTLTNELNRRKFFSPKEALKRGFIDEIIKSKK